MSDEPLEKLSFRIDHEQRTTVRKSRVRRMVRIPSNSYSRVRSENVGVVPACNRRLLERPHSIPYIHRQMNEFLQNGRTIK